jgi:hypothetical protein
MELQTSQTAIVEQEKIAWKQESELLIIGAVFSNRELDLSL